MGQVVPAGRWFRAGVLVLGLTALVPRIAAGQCSSTTTLACGETKSGTLSVVGEVDCFTFDAVAGETVSVTTSETAGVFQSCWEIKAPGGGSLTKFCSGQDTRTLPSTGTYTIEVSDSGNNQIGIYDINMVVVSDTASNCAEPVFCGPTLPRSLTAVGESDTFKFAGQIMDTVSITSAVTGGGMSACWELYDPTGGSLGGVCGQAERTLAVSGGHTIRVYDNGDNATGTYDLNLVVVSDSTSTCAETITCGQTIARTTALVGEADTFTFDAAAAETVSITAQETGGGTSTCWTLYDPAGLPIAGACGQEAHTLAEGGLYTIRVYDSSDASTGSYDLNLSFVSDTASSCAAPITCGQPLVDREIVSVGESKTYTFASVADETVSITAQQTSALLDACWELYDPDGISVVGACGQATKTLAVPGNYTIRVSDNGDNQTGTFNVDLDFVSDTGSSCAEGIMCGDELPREITAIGESQTFRYEAAAGEAVSISAQETGGFVSACWEVYDPAGISLGGSCSQGEKTFAAAGGYTIRISDNNDSEIGTYSLNLVVLSDTDHNCATPLACGQTATGSISQPGESKTYAVSGQTGDVVAIDTLEIGGALNACWEFYDPAGTSLGGVCGKADRTLATDLGVHTVRVYDSGENDTGDFQISLCNPTTTTTSVEGSTTTTTIPTAGGDFPVSGASLLLKDSAKTQKRRLVVVSKDSSLSVGLGVGTEDDPTQQGGKLRVRSVGGGFDATYDLEPIGWRLLKKKDPSKGWKYTKGNAIKLAILKAGRSLRIVGRGAALQHALASDPSPVDVVFSLGARRFCMGFGGTTKFKQGASYTAKDAPPPAKCPDPAP
jgi:hypothetical protein